MGDRERSRTIVAAFDFDHTLTSRDSVVPFLLRVGGWRALLVAILRHPVVVVSAGLRRDRDRLRELATEAVFTGRPVAEVERVGDDFAMRLLDGALRDDVVARLRAHLDSAHRVVIVSASYEYYLLPVAGRLGVEAVLSTRLRTDDGVCTGHLDGPNCRGAEKVRRLEAWLDGHGLRRDDVVVHAYGDSPGDRAMLAWADHPTWVTSAPIAESVPW